MNWKLKRKNLKENRNKHLKNKRLLRKKLRSWRNLRQRSKKELKLIMLRYVLSSWQKWKLLSRLDSKKLSEPRNSCLNRNINKILKNYRKKKTES